jgi:hypothetical protein
MVTVTVMLSLFTASICDKDSINDGRASVSAW